MAEWRHEMWINDKPPELVKINLGCSTQKLEGMINVDITPTCNPDKVMDISKPWDFPSDYFDEIYAYHILEHLDYEQFIECMKEIYRCGKDGCFVKVEIPHIRHDMYWIDPSHKLNIMPETFNLFDRNNNIDMINGKMGNTPLALIHNINIVPLEWHRYLEKDIQEKLDKGELTKDEVDYMEKYNNNIVWAYGIDLKVVKF